MDFLLNLSNSKENLFLFTIAISLALSLVMTISFSLSKKFVNLELDRLGESSGKFDRLIIITSSAILSMITVVIGIMFVSIISKCFYERADEICYSYMKLMIVFSVILIVSYTLIAPNHSHLRFLSVPDKEAKYIYSKCFRMAIVSFAITIVFYPIISIFKDTEYNLFFEYLSIATIIIYYFSEMIISKKMIADLLSIKKVNQYCMSAKLTTFLNDKFTYFSLGCMLYVVAVNYSHNSSNDVLLLTHLNAYLFLFEIFAFQSIVVFFINKFLCQLKSLEKGDKSKRAISNRKKNLVWICDVIVLGLYFSVLCFAIQFAGIDLKKYLFRNNLVTISGIAFITIIIYKGFNEIKDSVLEKAESGNDEYYTKLKTFFPTLSAAFYVILFITSSLIALSNLGINITPILATFSIFSAAVGLAAKDIIQAFLQGFTLLIEKNLYVGEFVKVNDMTGIIEKLSVRVIQIRDLDGSVHIIPYNFINSITNYSKDYSCHLDSLRLSSSKDINKACEILTQLINTMKKEEKYYRKILGDLKIHGLKPFDLTGVQILWEIKTTPDAVGADFTYDLYSRLVDEFNKAGIEVPIASNINAPV